MVPRNISLREIQARSWTDRERVEIGSAFNPLSTAVTFFLGTNHSKIESKIDWGAPNWTAVLKGLLTE